MFVWFYLMVAAFTYILLLLKNSKDIYNSIKDSSMKECWLCIADTMTVLVYLLIVALLWPSLLFKIIYYQD
jgi:hypothetical protein